MRHTHKPGVSDCRCACALTVLCVCGCTLVLTGCKTNEGGGRRWLNGSRLLRALKSNPEARVECYKLGSVCRCVVLDWLSVVYFRLNQFLALDGSFAVMIQH